MPTPTRRRRSISLGFRFLRCNASRDRSSGGTSPSRIQIARSFRGNALIGKLKGPILRGVAARAPYFHNGSAATLMDVVNFYDQRFGIGFAAEQKLDLVAFLNAL
jgi:cytochrome c peroxidase